MSKTLIVFTVFAALLLTQRVAEAQQVPAVKTWNLLVSSGNVVPTGAQSETLESAKLTVAQVSRQLTPEIAMLGTVGWARTRGASPEFNGKIDVFVYDLGAEAHTPALKGRVTFRSFAGGGAGGRTYCDRDDVIDAAHHGSLYASAGAEFGFGRVQLRAEVRDYISRFTPFDGNGAASVRNDIAVLLGLRFGARP